MSERIATPWGSALRIPEWPGYLATETGSIVSNTNWRGYGQRLLVGVDNGDGYLKVRLHRPGDKRRHNRPIHRLVAEAWLPPRPSPQHQMRHLDGNRLNNAVANLAWGTAKDNADDRARHGRTRNGYTAGTRLRVALKQAGAL